MNEVVEVWQTAEDQAGFFGILVGLAGKVDLQESQETISEEVLRERGGRDAGEALHA